LPLLAYQPSLADDEGVWLHYRTARALLAVYLNGLGRHAVQYCVLATDDAAVCTREAGSLPTRHTSDRDTGSGGGGGTGGGGRGGGGAKRQIVSPALSPRVSTGAAGCEGGGATEASSARGRLVWGAARAGPGAEGQAWGPGSGSEDAPTRPLSPPAPSAATSRAAQPAGGLAAASAQGAEGAGAADLPTRAASVNDWMAVGASSMRLHPVDAAKIQDTRLQHGGGGGRPAAHLVSSHAVPTRRLPDDSRAAHANGDPISLWDRCAPVDVGAGSRAASGTAAACRSHCGPRVGFAPAGVVAMTFLLICGCSF